MKNTCKRYLGGFLVVCGWYLCDLAGWVLDGANALVDIGGRIRLSAQDHGDV